YYCLPDNTLTRGIRKLKKDIDMVEFMRIGYENDKQMDLFIEHDVYDVLEYTANDNLVAKNFSNDNFIGARSDPMPFLIGNYNAKEDGSEVDIIDPIYKKKLRKTKKRIRKRVKVLGEWEYSMGGVRWVEIVCGYASEWYQSLKWRRRDESYKGGGTVGRIGGSNSKIGGGSIGRGGGSSNKIGSRSICRGGGSNMGKGGGSTTSRGIGLSGKRGGGSVGRGGGSNIGRGGGSNSKRSGGSTTNRGSGSSSKRGGGSNSKRGGMKRGW
ncbi:hypothetical protein Tco_1333162, partial [Tanacetum coccineum]